MVRRIVVAGIVVPAAVLVLISTGYFVVPPCAIWGIPGANALIAYRTIDQVYEGAEVVLVGQVADVSNQCIGSLIATRMTVDVEEYLKNPQQGDRIQVMALGGTIGGHGMWVEDEKIFDEGQRVLLFLEQGGDERIPAGEYHVGVYSAAIGSEAGADKSLLEGIELAIEERAVSVGKGESRIVQVSVTSLLGYSGETDLSVEGYKMDAEGRISEVDLADYGINIGHEDVIAIEPNETVSTAITLAVAQDATPGEYMVAVQAIEPGSESLSWKNPSRTFSVTVGSI